MSEIPEYDLSCDSLSWSELSSLQWEPLEESIKSMNALLLLLQQIDFQNLYNIFLDIIESNNIDEREIFRFMTNKNCYTNIQEKLRSYFWGYFFLKFESYWSFNLSKDSIDRFFHTIQTLIFQIEEFYKKWGRVKLKISSNTLEYLAKTESYFKDLLDKRDSIWWKPYEIDEDFYYLGFGKVPLSRSIKEFAKEMIIYNLLNGNNSIVFTIPKEEDKPQEILESPPLSTRIDSIMETIFAYSFEIKTHTIRFLHTLETQEEWKFWIRALIQRVISDVQNIRSAKPNIDKRPIPEQDYGLFYDLDGRISIALDILCNKLHDDYGLLDWVPMKFDFMSQVLTDVEKDILIEMAIESDSNLRDCSHSLDILGRTKYGTPVQQLQMINLFNSYWSMHRYPEQLIKQSRSQDADKILQSGRTFSAGEMQMLESIRSSRDGIVFNPFNSRELNDPSNN